MNHLDNLVHDWGWWNRAYTRALLRARGYRLVTMRETLPVVASVEELKQHENGALFWLEPRQSLHDLPPPAVALGEHAAYVTAYYKKEFAPRQDRPFIAYFKNPILFGRQFSIIDHERRMFEECFTRDRRWREGAPKRPVTPEKVAGTYLLAGTEFHNHYAHLFCDVLPRQMLFEEAGLAGSHPSLLPPPSHGFAAEAWQKLGLAGDASPCWDDKCWQMDGLYFASSFKKFCSWTPESAAWVRKRLVTDLVPRPPGKKIFYVSRRGGPRSIANEDEILQALQSLGVVVVQAEKLSLAQQIELFADARMIIGPHGAGIQNALWAPGGCAILELINPRYFSGVYWTLAASLGTRYGLVAGPASPADDPFGSYTCAPDLVRRAADQLLRPE